MTTAHQRVSLRKQMRFLFGPKTTHFFNIQTDKHMPPSLLHVIFKKSRHLGFGVFILTWSMFSAVSFILLKTHILSPGQHGDNALLRLLTVPLASRKTTTSLPFFSTVSLNLLKTHTLSPDHMGFRLTLIKNKIKFSSYIRKFIMQSHIWLTASSYMVKYLRKSSY